MGKKPTEILRIGEAASRLRRPTAELVQLVYERKIEFVLVDGVPHLAEDVVERYRVEHQRAS